MGNSVLSESSESFNLLIHDGSAKAEAILHQEPATPMISQNATALLQTGLFLDIFPRNSPVPVYMSTLR